MWQSLLEEQGVDALALPASSVHATADGHYLRIDVAAPSLSPSSSSFSPLVQEVMRWLRRDAKRERMTGTPRTRHSNRNRDRGSKREGGRGEREDDRRGD
eukprot:396264-Rhodomonas_salina.1